MPVTRKKTSAEWIEILNCAACRAGRLLIDESFADPQVKHRHGAAGALPGPRRSHHPRIPCPTAPRAASDPTPAPELGQDNEDILDVDHTKDQIADLQSAGSSDPRREYLRHAKPGTVEALEPTGPVITLYVCGITPHDTTHLGHAFTYTVADVPARHLESQG